MTNTPMTFEEWYAQHDSLAEYSAKQAWQASQASQQAEMDALKYDLDGYMKIAHASATEIVQQAQTIAELVEALERLDSTLLITHNAQTGAFLNMNELELIKKAIAKAKGTTP